MSDQYINTVDQYGNITGVTTRMEAHRNNQLIHQTVHCLILNEQGDVYLQKRSLTKDLLPGYWDTSVGGHVDLNEMPDHAVRRETFEELGIEGGDFQFLYRYLHATAIESELVYTYFKRYNGPFRLNPLEISEGRFFKEQEIETKKTVPGFFTPNFIDEWQRFKESINERRHS